MTNASVESEPDMSLVGLAGWLLFLWGVLEVFPEAWRAPWSFNGWFSFVLSTAAWVVVGLPTVGILVLYITAEQKSLLKMSLEFGAAVAGWGIVFVGLVAFLHLINRQMNVGAYASTTVAERSTGDPLESNIVKLRGRQVKLGTFIVELEGERSTIVNRFRQTKDQADLQVFGNELLEIDRSLKQLKDEAHAVALTITKGESLLRKTNRQRRLNEAGVDSKELAEFRVEIEERLRPSDELQSAGEVIQLDRVIQEAVRSKR